MNWSSYHVVDPVNMQSRFATEDGMAFLETGTTEISEDSARRLKRVREIMEMLPRMEFDFIDLYYFKGLRQTDIARIFDLSQPSVCYRLHRSTMRIQFLLDLPEMSERSLRKRLSSALEDRLDVEIMVQMYRTTCQSATAKLLGESQGKIRHRFIRSLDRLRDHASMKDLVKLFDYIASNWLILREVKRFGHSDEVQYIVA